MHVCDLMHVHDIILSVQQVSNQWRSNQHFPSLMCVIVSEGRYLMRHQHLLMLLKIFANHKFWVKFIPYGGGFWAAVSTPGTSDITHHHRWGKSRHMSRVGDYQSDECAGYMAQMGKGLYDSKFSQQQQITFLFYFAILCLRGQKCRPHGFLRQCVCLLRCLFSWLMAD